MFELNDRVRFTKKALRKRSYTVAGHVLDNLVGEVINIWGIVGELIKVEVEFNPTKDISVLSTIYEHDLELYHEFKSKVEVHSISITDYKYTYKTDSGGFGLRETCGFRKPEDIRIGSVTCGECPHNHGFNDDENWVICDKIHIATNGKDK